MNSVRTNNGAEISPEENKHSPGQAWPACPVSHYDPLQNGKNKMIKLQSTVTFQDLGTPPQPKLNTKDNISTIDILVDTLPEK